jgi:hypothetical protein
MRRMLLDEMAQGLLQACGVDQIAAGPRRHDVIEDDALDEQLAVWPTDQTISSAAVSGRCSCSAMASISSSVNSQRARQSSKVIMVRPPCACRCTDQAPVIGLPIGIHMVDHRALDP